MPRLSSALQRPSSRNIGSGKQTSATSWRSSDRRGQQWIEQNALGVDLRAACLEIFLQLGRVERVVVFTIQFEANLPVGHEMSLRQVIQEKLPLGDFPEF